MRYEPDRRISRIRLEGRFVETFLVASWLEHLRQHERVTNADRLLQDAIARFHMTGTPKVTHLIAAEWSAPLTVDRWRVRN
jgi:hypothetical protein